MNPFTESGADVTQYRTFISLKYVQRRQAFDLVFSPKGGDLMRAARTCHGSVDQLRKETYSRVAPSNSVNWFLPG